MSTCFNFNCDCDKEIHALNNKSRCIVCLEDFTQEQKHPRSELFEGIRPDGPNKTIDLQNKKERDLTYANPIIKHHVKYFPQIVAYVHYRCHQKIHDPENPLSYLIQYTRDDSIKFYKERQ